VTDRGLRYPARSLNPDRLAPAIRLALAGAFVVAAAFAALVLYEGGSVLGLPTRAVAVLAVAAAAIALVIYRPVVLPLAAYVAVVPFDNLLQTGDGTITKFLGVAAAVTILLVMLDRRRTITPPVAVAAWGLFLVWSLASLMWAIDPIFGVGLFAQTAELFILYAMFSMLRIRSAEIVWIMLAALVGGVACSLYGIDMYVAGHVQTTDALSARLDLQFGTGSYINADHFSAALVFPLGIALVAFLRLNGIKRMGAGAAFIILLAGILVSATRGSLIAVGVMGVYLAFVERRRIQLIAIGAIGLMASAFMPNIWLRFLDPEQGGLGGRSGIWAIGLSAFRHYWLTGAGTGNFRLAYGEAYLKTPQTGEFFHPWMEFSHNLLVNTGVELGVVGLVLVLACWWIQFRVGKHIARASSLGAARSAVEAGTLGLFVVAMALDVMWYKYVWIAFMIGVLVRNAALADPADAAEPGTAPAALVA